MLLLKKHLVELVRAGKKRQTLRLWARPFVRVGELAYTPGLGRVRVVSVEELASLAALTERDAVADGFETLADLLAELGRIYGAGMPAGKRLYRVVFEWPAPAEGAKPKTPGAKRKRAAKASAKPEAKRPRRQASRAQREAVKAYVIGRAPQR